MRSQVGQSTLAVSEDTDVRTELRALGDRRKRVVAEQEEITAELRELVQRARAERVPVSEIATLAGVSPEAVYKIIRRA